MQRKPNFYENPPKENLTWRKQTDSKHTQMLEAAQTSPHIQPETIQTWGKKKKKKLPPNQ